MKRYKPWDAKPPCSAGGLHMSHFSGYDPDVFYSGTESSCAFPITERTVVLHLSDTERWHTEHYPWIRSQRLAMINFAIVHRDLAGYGGLFAVTFRTKEHAALFKLFWFE